MSADAALKRPGRGISVRMACGGMTRTRGWRGLACLSIIAALSCASPSIVPPECADPGISPDEDVSNGSGETLFLCLRELVLGGQDPSSPCDPASNECTSALPELPVSACEPPLPIRAYELESSLLAPPCGDHGCQNRWPTPADTGWLTAPRVPITPKPASLLLNVPARCG